MPRSLILVFACGLLSVACHNRELDRSQMEYDRAAAQTYFEDMQTSGTLSEHTIWPHYFTPNSAQLNELGERAVAQLTGYYRDNAGPLAVRRGEESSDLYAARVAAVHKALVDAGVDASRIQIVDGAAGGPGMASAKVVRILDKDRGKAKKSTSSGMESPQP